MRLKTRIATVAVLAAGCLGGWLAASLPPSGALAQEEKEAGTPKPQTPGFKGTIKLDVRDSVPDWAPYTPRKAPAGAPNVLFILYDDTGLAAWSPYGGRINMPTMDRLAHNGLIYTQWHTTALCSPTRSTILTGRNHHLTGNACITEGANGFPGAHGRIPPQCATIGPDPPGRRLEHVLARQESQCARAGRRPGRQPQAMAAAEGV